MPAKLSHDGACSEAETLARREAALKNTVATPHKPHNASKKGGNESQSK